MHEAAAILPMAAGGAESKDRSTKWVQYNNFLLVVEEVRGMGIVMKDITGFRLNLEGS